MTDAGLKNVIVFALSNKKLIGTLLNRFDPDDIKNGILAVPQEVLNRDLKMLIMDQSGDLLEDYQVFFDNGSLYLDLSLNINQLGKISAKFMLIIDEFRFNEKEHSIKFYYKEDVKSEGNFVQNMAVKAAGLKGSYLQTAVEFSKLDFIKAGKEQVTVDFDKIEGSDKIPSSLRLSYISCENGVIKFKFQLLD